MTNVNTAQNNFSSGELSPKVYGRFDLSAYFNGLRRMENFIGQTQGGAIFRGGFHFVAETKSGNKAFIQKFKFSDIQSYALEFTDLNIRIYKDRGIVLNVGVPVDIVTPYLESELFELKFAQDAIDLYIVHPNHQPRKLTRTSDTAWTIALHAPAGVVPAFSANNYPSAVGIYEQRLIYGGSITNPETLWFSKSALFDDFTIGTGATDGLKYTVAVGDTNNIKWIKGTEDFLTIGGIGDILRATGGEGESAIAPDQISIKPTNTFGVADQNPVARRQSIIYTQDTQRTLLSFEKDELGVYKPVDNNVASDHITDSGINQLAYMEGRPDVVWAVKENGDLIGMTLNRAQQVSGWGRHTTDGDFISVATTPRARDYDTLWVCVKRVVNGSNTYHIEYLNDNPTFPRREDFVTGPDNEIADDDTFQRALFEAQRQYIHVDNAATFDGAQRAIDAGASLTIGAVTGSGITFTASAAVFVSGDVGNEIVVKSTDGSRFGIATITGFTSTTIITCGIDVDFDAVTAYPAGEWYITADTITGLTNLEGRTVSVVTDGAVHPERTVASGSITLEAQASVVHVGLPYTGTLETMDLEGGGTTGTSQTKKKSVYKIGMRLLDTSGLEFGSNYYKLEDRLLREAIDLMDNPPPLFTGDEIIRFEDGGDDGWARSKRIIVRQTLPLPAVVQLVVPYFTVSNVD